MTLFNHSITDNEPEDGTYYIQFDNGLDFDYEIARGKTSAFEMADGVIADGYTVTDIYLVHDHDHYLRRDYEQELKEIAYFQEHPEELEDQQPEEPEEPELVELKLEFEDHPTENGFLVFANGKQTPYSLISASVGYDIYYGDRKVVNGCDTPKVVRFIRNCIKSGLVPDSEKKPVEVEVTESKPLVKTASKKQKRLVGLPQYFKEYESYIVKCLSCFDSYKKAKHTSVCCSWKITLNGFKGVLFLSQSLDWSIESTNPDEFPFDIGEFLSDNGIEVQ
jgi:hypothetical protein